MKEQTEPKLTAEIKLAIHETVESRLKELPASTYQMIQKMVDDNIAARERFWRNVIIIGGIAFTILSSALGAGFFILTAKNASKKASDAIAQSAVGQKLKDVEQAYSQILNIKNQVEAVGPEAIANAIKIT